MLLSLPRRTLRWATTLRPVPVPVPDDVNDTQMQMSIKPERENTPTPTQDDHPRMAGIPRTGVCTRHNVESGETEEYLVETGETIPPGSSVYYESRTGPPRIEPPPPSGLHGRSIRVYGSPRHPHIRRSRSRSRERDASPPQATEREMLRQRMLNAVAAVQNDVNENDQERVRLENYAFAAIRTRLRTTEDIATAYRASPPPANANGNGEEAEAETDAAMAERMQMQEVARVAYARQRQRDRERTYYHTLFRERTQSVYPAGIIISDRHSTAVLGFDANGHPSFRIGPAYGDNDDGMHLTYDQLLALDPQGTGQLPAEQDYIRRLKKHKHPMSSTAADSSSTRLESCSICMEPAKAGQSITTLPGCGHQYHSPCIERWLGQNATCPLDNIRLDASTTP